MPAVGCAVWDAAENATNQVEPRPVPPPKCPELWGAACEALGWPPDPKAYPALRGLWQGAEHRRIIVADGKWSAIPANPRPETLLLLFPATNPGHPTSVAIQPPPWSSYEKVP